MAKRLQDKLSIDMYRERSARAVECLTRDRGVAGSSHTGGTVLFP